MQLKIIRKIKYLFNGCKKLYFITNSIAYKELKSNKILEDITSCCVFVGEYFDSKENKSFSNFTLPLSAIRLKPYSFLAKIQVLYADLFQLLISFFYLLNNNQQKKIIFTSILNSRALYFLDKFLPRKISVIDWQYKYIYKYLFKKNNQRKVSFKYGDFEFRASHRLSCKIIFPYGQNTQLSRKLKYNKNGDIIIIHNPNRSIEFWLNLKNIIRSKTTSKKYIFIIHPKTFKSDIKVFKDIFKDNKYNSNIYFKTLENYIGEQDKIIISLCYSLSSSLDFIFFDKNIPVTSPIKRSNFL